MDTQYKGNSIIAFPDDYVVVDLETTGYSPLTDEIIEIAAIRVKNGMAVSTFQQLVKPTEPIDIFITGITGITDEMVAKSPSISEVLPRFRDSRWGLPLGSVTCLLLFGVALGSAMGRLPSA